MEFVTCITPIITPKVDKCREPRYHIQSSDVIISIHDDPVINEEGTIPSLSIPLNDKMEPLKEWRKTTQRKEYIKCVVQETKNRFGCPTNNPANRLAVRKHLLDNMRTHGLRPTHINQVIDVCVVLVLTPNDSEMLANAIERSMEVQSRRAMEVGFFRRILRFFCSSETQASI
jgi:hypothetical protein